MDVVRTSVYVMGLVIQRHNEFRDAIGDLSALAWGQVCREPIVRESDIRNKSSALVADLVIGGVRSDQSDALLDICVVNTDAQSYLSRSPSDVLAKAEEEKKAKYLSACEARRALFTPICVSVDGMVGREANAFLKRLGDRLSLKWTRPYSEVINWIRTRLTFAIIRASLLCLRGSRTKWRSIDTCDGAPLDLIMS